MKQLGMPLNANLDFGKHLQYVIDQVSKRILLLRKIVKISPNLHDVHLDYDTVICDQAYCDFFFFLLLFSTALDQQFLVS